MRNDRGTYPEPYGEPVGVSSHWCRAFGGRVYCDRGECPRCGPDDD